MRNVTAPMNRRQAAGLAAFLLAMLAVIWTGDALLGRAAMGILKRSQNRFSMLYANHAAADILLLGNSQAVNAFHAPEMTRRTGLRCFHLGYNGVSSEVASCLLEDYLARYSPPRLLLMEATMNLAEPGVAATLVMFRDESPCLGALADRAYPDVRLATRLSRLYRFNSEFFWRSLVYMRESDQNWINRRTAAPAALKALRGVPSRRVDISPENFRAWNAILERATHENITVRVVLAPMHPAGRALRSGFSGFRDLVEQSCRQHGVEFLDYSEVLDGRDAFFADGSHMNFNGSQVLLEIMLRDGVLDSPPAEE